MPNPTSSTTIQRPELGAIAYEYMIDAANRGFIGTEIFPIFPVQDKTADYPVIPLEALIKLPPTLRRGARGNYQRGDYEFETGTYACQEYGWEEPVDDSEANLYRRFFDSEEVATLRAVDHLLRDHERRVSAAVFNTSNVTNTAAVSTEWSTASSCTPKADVKGGLQALRAATGIDANAIAISKKVFENVMICAEIKDYLQYTSPHLLNTIDDQRLMLARYFGVDEVVVGGAIRDSAKKNKTMTITDMWDDEYCLLFKKAMNTNDLREPTLGRTFLWTSDSPDIVTTEMYREEQIRSNIYRVRHSVDEAFVFTGAGYLLSNITA